MKMTFATMFICSLWAPSKSHQLSTLTKTSCYWCQTCQDAAAAEEGTASCSDGAPSAQFAVTQTGLLLSQKKKRGMGETPNQCYWDQKYT